MPVPKGTSLDPARTRQMVIDTLEPLLYSRGLDGIGVAELCAAAGISKQTLYRHFGSKDCLTEAVLAQRSDRVIKWVQAAAHAAGPDPEARLVGVIEALGGWYAESGFRGCAMMNSAAQHRAVDVLGLAGRHLDRYLELLTGIGRDAGVSQPDRLGRQLLQLIEGATAVAAVKPQEADTVAEDLRFAAVALFRAAQEGASGSSTPPSARRPRVSPRATSRPRQ